ncbi:putative cyclin-dependent protein kinase inhibitor SMR [Helianthus annuus]|uniref:Cyclin-dependent protein kinase inhibitor SMR n=1 Tax=Helianthus annuus TaxID=4232 RepID=A0A9K3EDJ7_HELAN|nr:putative cyclin-dependent protein kinase inhibitor SMR [Helianthus annuus]KAJ0470671.1 putative cyclin-dependent protein kinase inhibitor SMR [Helianthus annuus]KAJ0842116.1 putative cyclin-dependent protein kinase inhibitor SMR [Helianthus annuus]KAJ0855677.1 putative cyclin-dependent protein kinase inhibitor SMR [Helianthus annuus]
MEVDGGYLSADDGCRTPKRSGFRVPMKCPAAPKKKTVKSKQKMPPASGYFQSPDIEIFFAMACRRGACA